MDYIRPDDLSEALGALSRRPRIVAGCTDLFAATQRPALEYATDRPLLDITGIEQLRGIDRTAKGWRIGATTTWSTIRSASLPPAFRALQQSAAEVGSIQIQNSATLAGNLCNASPAADGVPPLLILDAEVELQSADGSARQLPLAEFLTEPRRTALRPDEMMTAILVADSATSGRSTFLKLGARRYLVISIAMVAARIDTLDGRIANAAISVGSCSAVATRLHALERELIGCADTHAISPTAVAGELTPIADIRGDAAYRKSAAVTLVRRAVSELTSSLADRAA